MNPAGFNYNLTPAVNTLQELADEFDQYRGRPRLFVSETTVSPATPGAPLLSEIVTAVGANRDTIVYYTGTNTSTDAPTYVYHVDRSEALRFSSHQRRLFLRRVKLFRDR